MSYLDLPRLHFAGLFFTNPDTINNVLRNFNPDTRLEGPNGAYIPAVVGWNPLGVAQLWVEQCAVLAAVGPGGPVTGDPVLGAPVVSPSPKTPQKTPDGKGLYDFAKLVDLDQQQQARSAVYGLRLGVELPGGGGFAGAMTVPELQYMTPRVNAPTGSWAMVGTWMGHLEDVAWSGDVSSSPFLAAFREACARGVAVKLTVDLHQNNPQAQFTSGNLFLYGRVHGSMGPVQAGELPQVWPGRLIAPPAAESSPAASVGAAETAPAPAAAAAPEAGGEGVLTLDDRARAAFRPRPAPAEGGGAASLAAGKEAAADAAPPSTAWSPVPAQVQTVDGTTWLSADFGNAIELGFTQDGSIFSSDGRFLVDDGIELGVVDAAAGGFRPLTHGAVSFADLYRPLQSLEKTVDLVAGSGVVAVPLTAEEATLVADTPLAVRFGGQTVLAEAADGVLMDLSVRSLRLEQGGSATFRLLARRFGQPIVGQRPVTWTVQPNPGGQPGDLAFEWLAPTDAHGLATLRVTATTRPLTLPANREPLDSLVYYVTFDGPDGAIGDGPYFIGTIPNLTVLLFQQFTAPAQPTWEDDVGPVLEAYARLYPGMQDKLDIADETTVLAYAPAIAARMSLPIGDPAYMPVTRDLSPAKVKMIVDWLNAQSGKAT